MRGGRGGIQKFRMRRVQWPRLYMGKGGRNDLPGWLCKKSTLSREGGVLAPGNRKMVSRIFYYSGHGGRGKIFFQ